MENNNKQEVMIKASNNSCLTKEMLTEIWYMKGLMGIYNLGLENMYDYLIKNSEVRKHGKWERVLIRNDKGGCIGEKMNCSVCNMDNCHDEEMKYCPNCGAVMDLDGEYILRRW